MFPKWGKGGGRMMGGALCWSSQLLGKSGWPKKPQTQNARGAPTLGKPRLRLPEEGPGETEGTGTHAPGWWVSWEPPPPGVSACGGEGLDKLPLAVLLGVGTQALWLAGEVLGGWGPPSLGPHPCSTGASPAHDPRAAHWPPLWDQP